MTYTLETRALRRTFGAGPAAVEALRGVDLVVRPGEFVALVGPSGCGKSTLLHLAAGLDRPSSGEVWLVGSRVDTLAESGRAALRRRSAGFVFQFFNLIPNLSVADNVELPARLTGFGQREARARRDELLARLGLSSVAGWAPSRLSGGQQQRVAVARALVHRPALILADEPTGNLDSDSAREVLALLREGRDAGQALLLSTHDARIAAAADRIVTMRDGSVVDEVSLRDLVAPERVAAPALVAGGQP